MEGVGGGGLGVFETMKHTLLLQLMELVRSSKLRGGSRCRNRWCDGEVLLLVEGGGVPREGGGAWGRLRGGQKGGCRDIVEYLVQHEENAIQVVPIDGMARQREEVVVETL